MATTEVRWVINPLAAALALGEQGMGSPEAGGIEAAAVIGWRNWLGSSGLDVGALLDHLVPLSVRVDREAELAAGALNKTMGHAQSGQVVAALARELGAMRRAAAALEPARGDALEADSAPLREAWDAIAGRLLAGIIERTDAGWLVESADVLLVPAVDGRRSRAFAAYNLARIEVGTVGPDTALPEVVRLAWLVGQLNADLPLYQGQLTRQEALRAAALAMAPVTLDVAQAVGAVENDAALRRLAVERWCGVAADQIEGVATSVERWWEVFRRGGVSWAAGLAALAAMLKAESASGG